MLSDFPKYYRDGKVGVLVSHGYGAGWSTWATGAQRTRMAMDANLVGIVVAHEYDVDRGDMVAALDAKLAELFPDDPPYSGGASGLVVYWLTPGTQFRINEYDGNETLEVATKVDWLSA